MIYFIILIFLITYKFKLKAGYWTAIFLSFTAILALSNKQFALFLSVIFLLAPFICSAFKNYSNNYISAAEAEAKDIEEEFNKSKSVEATLNKQKENLEEDFSRIESNYEITKEFCSSLDINQIQTILKNYLLNLKVCDDCIFSFNKEGISEWEKIFSVDFEGSNFGFVGVKNLMNEESFNIIFLQFSLALRRAISYAKIQELAITDDLTHLFSRRHMLERFVDEFSRSVKHKLNLSFIMVDIDDFKNYNDQFGHLVGDALLCQIADIIKRQVREIDLVARYGGEEFAIILPQTDKNGAHQVAERIREDIRRQTFKAYDEALKLTVSLGVATYPEDAKWPQVLIDCADRALYQAKAKGKNLTVSG